MSATDTDIEQQRQRRGWLRGELLLAIPPTVVMLLAVVLLETLRHERILFASLAASAYLIYRDPVHPMNGVRVMVGAHSVAVVTGVSCGAGLRGGHPGDGRDAAGAHRVSHCPSPGGIHGARLRLFARPIEAAGLFVVALSMIAVLIVLQRTALWTLRRLQAHTPPAKEADP
jgi:hypothetical protein